MNTLFIEELDRAGRVEHRHRLAGPSVTIGRGYGNDVIIDDPKLGAEHLQLLVHDDGLQLSSLASAGAFTVAGKPQQHWRVDQDAVVHVGDTRLRFRTADYQVAHAEAPARYDWRARLERPQLAFGLYLLALLVLSVQSWLHETDILSPLNQAMPLLALAIGMLVWAGGWALSSRLLVKHHHYPTHLAVVSMVVLAAVLLLDSVVEPLSLLWLPGWLYPASFTALAALWLYAHLRLCSQGSRRPLQLVLLTAAAGAAYFTLDMYSEAHRFSPHIPADVRVSTVVPPAWQPSETPEQFFSRAGTLADEADAAGQRID
ncbi:FHA domain-containing protein [Chitinimonas sp.]|uniref:FHA domain-containing protein n=1 Tax=Chitinimonas sp. TaxID=1934313 RepID=UPI0035B3CE65